jgi:hypothetical protein
MKYLHLALIPKMQEQNAKKKKKLRTKNLFFFNSCFPVHNSRQHVFQPSSIITHLETERN